MGYYILDSLEIENFLSHKNTKINFSSGSLAFVGENGAGKSSILEALYFALTLKPWRDRAYLINANSKKAVVKIRLKELEGNDMLELRVDLAKKGNDSFTTEVILKRNNKVEATRQEDYKRLVKQYLNMQSVPDITDFLQSSIIVKQNTLNEIASKMTDNKKDFKELIERALGIESYKDAEEGLKKVDIRSENQSIGLIYNIKQRHLDEVNKNIVSKKQEYDMIINKINEIKIEIQKKDREKQELENLINSLKKQLDEEQDKVLELNSLRTRKEELLKYLNKRQKEIEELQKEIEELQKEIENIESQKSVADLYDKLNEYDSLSMEFKDLESKIKELEFIKNNYEQMIKYQEYEEKYNGLNRERDEINDKLKKVEISLNYYNNLYKEYKNRINKIKNLKNNFREFANIDVEKDLDQFINQINEEIKQINNEKEELDKKINNIKEEIIKRETEIKRMKEYLNVLNNEDEKSVECPVCHTKLSGKTIEDLRNNYLNEINIHTNELDKLKKERELLDKSQREIDDKQNKIKNLMQEITIFKEQITEEMKESGKKANELSLNKKELEQKLNEISDNLDDIKAFHEQYLAAKVNLEKSKIDLSKINEKINEYEEMKKRYSDLDNSLKNLLKLILDTTKVNNVRKAREIINNARAKYMGLENIKNSLMKNNEELISMKNDLNDNMVEYKNIEEKINQFKNIEEKINELKNEIDGKMISYQNILKDISRLEGEKKNNEDNANKLENEIKALEEIKNKIIVGLASINVFNKVQRSLYNNALIALENEMNNVFSKFGLDYSRIEIRENQDGNIGVYVIDRNGNERPISVLSGGEQSVIALAFVIALNKIIQAKIGFLALDEPTESLDEQRRKILIEILSKLTESNDNLPPPIYQLLVITHHNDIMESIDQVCNVAKEDGISKVICEGD
ncbi:ATPase involved in DNA repair [Caldisphaera lagunensis DSM 15908]|uniref:ATPase involved in DNA repair n=1 Tax=Caldisphaera lagunensis (strain DSM 15908 / JCM 11604 / ANMR 0165 / IC-154) TaxID=1056495 RepID=L0AB40_CALLD|nr:SMC family ATPase [Caldisphaera lagunensis]AFZ70362.1 ATPase involved in DNA repair [Caldisphaera lagunensis DSM 15908]